MTCLARRTTAPLALHFCLHDGVLMVLINVSNAVVQSRDAGPRTHTQLVEHLHQCMTCCMTVNEVCSEKPCSKPAAHAIKLTRCQRLHIETELKGYTQGMVAACVKGLLVTGCTTES